MQRETGVMQEIMLREYGEFCNIKNLMTSCFQLKIIFVKEFVEIAFKYVGIKVIWKGKGLKKLALILKLKSYCKCI